MKDEQDSTDFGVKYDALINSPPQVEISRMVTA